MYRIPPDQDIITGLHRRFKDARQEAAHLIDDRVAWRAVQECLLTEDPLLAFAAWYSTWLNGNMSFAQMWGVKETKLGLGITLFEMEPFRVELFLFKPGSVIPNHSHPDVESYEVYISGDMELTKDNLPQTVREAIVEAANGVCLSNGGMIRIPAGSTHGGWINHMIATSHGSVRLVERGGAFMSIQYWLGNFKDESVTYNWKGEDSHG